MIRSSWGSGLLHGMMYFAVGYIMLTWDMHVLFWCLEIVAADPNKTTWQSSSRGLVTSLWVVSMEGVDILIKTNFTLWGTKEDSERERWLWCFFWGGIETMPMLGHTETMCYKLLILVRTRMTHGSYNIEIDVSMWRCGMKLKFQHILQGMWGP